MFENVVVGIGDYQGGRDALELAETLVSGHGAVTLLYVEPREIAVPESATGSAAERQRLGLMRLGRLRDRAHVNADVARIEADSVRQGLHEFAASHGANLIAIGAGQRNPLSQIFSGDRAHDVLEEAPCAVAVAPARYSGRAGIGKLGIAYDGSPESERAVTLARTIAAELGASLSAFEAVPAQPHVRGIPDVRRETDDDVTQARQKIAALGDVEPHAERADDTVEALRRYGESVDLLVLGSHNYRPPDRVAERSKSQRLADEPPSPLLVLASAERDGSPAGRHAPAL